MDINTKQVFNFLIRLSNLQGYNSEQPSTIWSNVGRLSPVSLTDKGFCCFEFLTKLNIRTRLNNTYIGLVKLPWYP